MKRIAAMTAVSVFTFAVIAKLASREKPKAPNGRNQQAHSACRRAPPEEPRPQRLLWRGAHSHPLVGGCLGLGNLSPGRTTRLDTRGARPSSTRWATTSRSTPPWISWV